MNKSAEFNFSYEVMMYVNVLHIDIKFRIFSQNYNFLIMLKGGTTLIAQLS